MSTRALTCVALFSLVAFGHESNAQFQADVHPCDLVPPQRYTDDGRRTYTPEEFERHVKCEDARLAELQAVLDASGVDCQALDLMLGECAIDTIVSVPPQPVAPEADVAERLGHIDELLEAIDDYLVVE